MYGDGGERKEGCYVVLLILLGMKCNEYDMMINYYLFLFSCWEFYISFGFKFSDYVR